MLGKTLQFIQLLRKQKIRLPVLLLLSVSIGCLFAIAASSEEAYAESVNSQYSLEGAVYQLYTDESCTTAAKDANGNNAVLTTDAAGNAPAIEMKTGTYYAKETSAGRGYMLDTGVYKIKVTDANNSGNPAVFTSAEPPACGIPVFRVYKTMTGAKYAFLASSSLS